MALGLCLVLPVSLPDMVGILCGATTNTPALGAAQQALEAAGQPSGGAALGCAVTYPLGVVGVILAMILIRKLLVKPADLEPRISMEEDNTYVAQFVVINPALEGKTLSQISQKSHIKFIISRIWRNGEVIMPLANTQLHINDNVLVVTMADEIPSIEILLGKKIETDWNKKKIDWNAIDAHGGKPRHCAVTPRAQRQASRAAAPARHLRSERQPHQERRHKAAGHPRP